VDDVCTTGASTIQAIEAAREFGFEIIGVMCLVEREEARGRPAVEKAAATITLTAGRPLWTPVGGSSPGACSWTK